MEDQEIVQLIWDRQEHGLRELSTKYNGYCYSVSYRIVHDAEDARECVNDTWLKTWNAIPPERPRALRGFLAKIVRNLSLNRYRNMHADRRGGGIVNLALEELQECVSDGRRVEERIELQELTGAIEAFLRQQTQRNFYLMQIREIAERHDMREGTVKSVLGRMRKELRTWLRKEAVYL